MSKNPITREVVFERLTNIVREVLDAPTLELRDPLQASEVEEWTSLNHIRIVSTAEDEFGVRFTAAEIEKLATVGEFVDLVMRKVSEA